jgi:hypothetical protein
MVTPNAFDYREFVLARIVRKPARPRMSGEIRLAAASNPF